MLKRQAAIAAKYKKTKNFSKNTTARGKQIILWRTGLQNNCLGRGQRQIAFDASL